MIAKVIEDNPANFSLLSPYGLRNIPHYMLKALNENQLNFLLSKPEVVRSLDPATFAELIKRVLEKTAKSKQISKEEYS